VATIQTTEFTTPSRSDDAPIGLRGWLVLATISLIVTGLLAVLKAFDDLGLMNSEG
jgi:hypothetical protein